MNEEGDEAHDCAGLTEPDLVCEKDALAVGRHGGLGLHGEEGCEACELRPPKSAGVEVGGGRRVVEMEKLGGVPWRRAAMTEVWIPERDLTVKTKTENGGKVAVVHVRPWGDA